ncbi:hypothetical protein EBZ38_06455 [bacterium]|nr:hypothetical protein [bacterium]
MITILPENLEVANTYLETNSIEETAIRLRIPQERVAEIINKKQVKDYLTQVYLDTGYRNRFTLARVLDELIAQKLQEASDTGFYTKADLLELLQFAHKLRLDEAKIQGPTQQTNVQINEFGQGNYGELMKKLIGPI